jgi:hypothetical protein
VTKLYTVDEANRALPYVRSIVREVRERYDAIKERGQEHNRAGKDDEAARADLKEEIRAEAQRIHECMRELRAIGLELKDYELGLVDFPAEREGRAVKLCWKFDEPEVAHWHDVDEGYESRQPIRTS